MTRVEKRVIIFGLGTAVMFGIYSVMKPRVTGAASNQQLVQRRHDILQKENIDILYSTMTFFYLQGYNKTGEDLALFKEVLEVAKPKYVALQITQKTLENDQPILRNPFFNEAMKKVDYLLKTDHKVVEQLKELDFQAGLETLLVMHYCQQNNCKIICADNAMSTYDEQYQAKVKLKEVTQSGKVQVPENLKHLYEQFEIKDLDKPQNRSIKIFIFKNDRKSLLRSMVPDVPYKVVGLVNPIHLTTIVNNWKQRFLSVFGHEILEVENDELATTKIRAIFYDQYDQFIIISIIAICQGCIQICDLSYLIYQSNRFPFNLTDFETLRIFLQLPWIIKPLWGFTSDMIPIASQRRKPYLIIFALIAFLLENCLYFFDPEKKTVFLLLFLIALSFVFCNVVTEAMLVELSQEEHTARNVSLFFGMRALGGLVYTILQLNFPLHHHNSFQLLSIFPLLIAVSATFYQEKETQNLMNITEARQEIIQFLGKPIIYRPILFIFFFMATPSPSTSMFYFYINQLKLNDDFFNTLRYTYCLCSISAVLIYYSVRKSSFKKILGISNILYFIVSLLSLLLITGVNTEYNIPDHQFCMWDNIFMQTLQEINTLPVLVLACSMCPNQLEATIYSILMATINLANVISKEFGILLTYYLGITSQDFTKLWLLVLLCNIASQIPMPFIGAVDEVAVTQNKNKFTKDKLHKIL